MDQELCPRFFLLSSVLSLSATSGCGQSGSPQPPGNPNNSPFDAMVVVDAPVAAPGESGSGAGASGDASGGQPTPSDAGNGTQPGEIDAGGGAPDPDDGRQTIMSLTDACRERLRTGRAARRDWLSRTIATKLSAKEQQELGLAVGLLKRLIED